MLGYRCLLCLVCAACSTRPAGAPELVMTGARPVPAVAPMSFRAAIASGLEGLAVRDVRFVDVDGDGDLDLIALLAPPRIEVARGVAADGTPYAHFRSATPEDLRGLDPIAACLNDGSGRFSRASGTLLPDAPWATVGMAWTDVDGDGDEDVCLWGDPPIVYRCTGPLRFERVPVERPPGTLTWNPGWSVAWCDVQGDGLPELVYGSATGPLNVLANVRGERLSWNAPFADGSPEVRRPRVAAAASASSAAIDVGDFDGDGDLDVVLAPWTADVRAFRNDGFGRFTSVQAVTEPSVRGMGTPWEPAGCRLVDLDDDGALDLVVAAKCPPGSGAFQAIHRNDGSGRFLRVAGAYGEEPWSTQAIGCVSADFDADGDEDLLLLGEVNWCTRLVENLGGMRFRVVDRTPERCWPGAAVAAVADVDGDGDVDICLGTSTGTKLYLNRLR